MKLTASAHVSVAAVNGIDGQSAFTLDLDNEMDTVPTRINALGQTVADGAYALVVAVNAYYGTTDVKSECSISVSGYNGKASASNGNLHIDISDGMEISADRRSITVTATHPAHGTRNAVFTLVRGLPGQPVYRIVPSASQAVKRKDGTCSPSDVSFTVSKTLKGRVSSIGPNVQGYTNEGLVFAYRTAEGMTAATGDSSFSTDSFIDGRLEVAIYKGQNASAITAGNLLDRETIPVVEDGSDGTDKGAFVPNVSPVVFSTDAKGALLPASKTATITAKAGDRDAHVKITDRYSDNASKRVSCSIDAGGSGDLVASASKSVTISGIPVSYYKLDGTPYNGTPASGQDYRAIPATSGYAIVRCQFIDPDNPSNTLTTDITIPFTVDLKARHGQQTADDLAFMSEFTTWQTETDGALSTHNTQITQNSTSIANQATAIQGVTTRMTKVEQTASGYSISLMEQRLRKNLIKEGLVNFVHYAGSRIGWQRAYVRAGHAYVFSFKYELSKAMHDAGGFIFAELGQIAVLTGDVYGVAATDRTAFVPDSDGWHDIRFRTVYPPGKSATTSRYYRVEWVMLEDVTDKMPDYWRGYDDETKDVELGNIYEERPMDFISPFSLSVEDAGSQENLCDTLARTVTGPWEAETFMLDDITEVKGWHYNRGESTTGYHDIRFALPPELLADYRTVALSFYVKLGDNATNTAITTHLYNSSYGGTAGVYCAQAAKVGGVNRTFAYSGGAGEVTITPEKEVWNRVTITYTPMPYSGTGDTLIYIRAFDNNSRSDYTEEVCVAGIKIETGGRDSWGDEDFARATGIYLRKGTIDMVASRFTLRNNNGEKTMGVDAQGSMFVRGTIKAAHVQGVFANDPLYIVDYTAPMPPCFGSAPWTKLISDTYVPMYTDPDGVRETQTTSPVFDDMPCVSKMAPITVFRMNNATSADGVMLWLDCFDQWSSSLWDENAEETDGRWFFARYMAARGLVGQTVTIYNDNVSRAGNGYNAGTIHIYGMRDSDGHVQDFTYFTGTYDLLPGRWATFVCRHGRRTASIGNAYKDQVFWELTEDGSFRNPRVLNSQI